MQPSTLYLVRAAGRPPRPGGRLRWEPSAWQAALWPTAWTRPRGATDQLHPVAVVGAGATCVCDGLVHRFTDEISDGFFRRNINQAAAAVPRAWAPTSLGVNNRAGTSEKAGKHSPAGTGDILLKLIGYRRPAAGLFQNHVLASGLQCPTTTSSA